MSIFKRLIAIAILAISINAYGCSNEDNTEQLLSKLTISNSSLSFSQSDGRSIITTIGTIKNLSPSCAEELVIEVKYFDKQGHQIDVVTQPLYGIVVPPSQEVSFRVRDEADKSKEFYTTSTARIVSAEPRYSSKPKKAKPSLFADLLISWGPMLLLVGVWVFFMKKYNGKDSPQKQTLLLIEKQTDILRQQADSIERLASAIEQLNDKTK